MNAAAEIVRALEEAGVRRVFGIPGTHNIELWDELGRSRSVEPVLVTDERSGAFMADAVSRTSDQVGVLCVVPGAGVTHAVSGIAEAYLDCVPLVILACAVRSDTGRAYQLHDIDQSSILKAVTKETLRPSWAGQVRVCVSEALALARAGRPGPVAVEIPAELLLLNSSGGGERAQVVVEPPPDGRDQLSDAAALLNGAARPMIYAGNGARGACAQLRELARLLSCPVATTIQGKGVYPESDGLWLWNGFGASAPDFARRAAERCDAMLAVGARFSEVGTGSYGMSVPTNLIQVDIDGAALGRNYPAKVAVVADARAFLAGLLALVKKRPSDDSLLRELSAGHRLVRERALRRPSDRLRPAVLFDALQKEGGPDAVFVTDSGQGTFLAMEHLRLDAPGRFIGPIDFSCMGYSVPAAIGAKLADPDRAVFSLSGDGAFLMTAPELVTAASRRIAPVIGVIRDGELGQIAQFQRRALGRATATALAPYDLKKLSEGLGCAHLACARDEDAEGAAREALKISRSGRPVVLELGLDVSRETYFAAGVVRANFGRLPLGDKARLAARVVARKLF